MGLSTRFPGRLAATAALATAIGLAIASPAVAATITLNQSDVKASEFPEQDCTGPFANLPPGVDGWHFEFGGRPPGEFKSITLTFSTGSGTVSVGPITSTDSAHPDTGMGWSGYLRKVGNPARAIQAYVFTTAGWTLVTGTAETNPEDATGQFNLSHTCPGTPTTPTPTPTTATPTPTTPTPTTPTPTTSSPTVVPSGAPNTGGGGSQSSGSLVAGIGALALAGLAGTGFVLARRRRQEG